MTDKTQPEALRLALSIDVMDTFTNYQQEELDKAAAELRRQHARIAELEVELEAVGAGGVQALSAAPAGWKLVPVEPTGVMLTAAEIAIAGAEKTLGRYNAYAAAYRALLAASPAPQQSRPLSHPNREFPGSAQGAAITSESGTPPVEQQAAQPSVVYAELPSSVGDYKYGGGLFTDAQMRDFADRTHVLRMQAALKAAPVSACICGEPQASGTVHRVDGPCYVAAPQQEPIGWTTGIAWRSNTRLQSEQVVKITRDAQPEYGYTTPIYAAPQPAPAPLSDDSALLDWLATHGSFGVDSSTGEVGGNGQKRVAATRKNIRAALAAQGGKA